jgi:hypothetical protein
MEHALDFWIGRWECTWEGGHGRNVITRELAGRVIVERFEAISPEPFTGMSMSVSVFDPDAGWRQTWVDDHGSYWHFLGEAGAGTFTFATPEPVDVERLYKRMVFSDLAGDAFRWRWEVSPDRVVWTERWAIDYRRADPPAPEAGRSG